MASRACSSSCSPNNGGDCNQLVATTTTDGNGKYIFANLPPAHYCVVVPEI